MAEGTNAGRYDDLSAVADTDDDRWAMPQTAMFVTVASAGLWALILAGAHWLIG